MAIPGKDHPEALSLAQLFSTCVECFGLIHPGKEYDQVQRVTFAKLGIQQGRLLAWGDMVGITDVTASRDERLDEPTIRKTIEEALQSIIDRPADADRATQFEQFGLKPPKKFVSSYQPALDLARIEAFRERLEILQDQRWEVRRGMSITISHWVIADVDRFKKYLNLIKEKVDFLIGLMGVEDKVDRALKYDIKALAWHPIFDKRRASADMSKLRLIREACSDEYPEYAAATQGALVYLDKEWKDSYQEAMEQRIESSGSEIPGAAAYMLSQSLQLRSAYHTPKKSSRPGLLNLFRPKSWRKGSRDEGKSPPAESTDKARSQSYAQPSLPLSPPLTPERSKSIHVFPERPESACETRKSEENAMSRVDTAKSTIGTATVEPISSLISRHDQWRSPF